MMIRLACMVIGDDGWISLVVAGGMQILSPQLEPLTEPQRMLVGGLQHTSTQAEDALSQGMEKLQQNLAETLTAEADPFGPPDAYMMQMVTAVDKLKELVGFVTQVKPTDRPNRSPRTIHLHSPWIMDARPGAHVSLIDAHPCGLCSVGCAVQADHLRLTTLQQMHKILTTRQAARGLLALGDYFQRLRTLSSLWAARPREAAIS
jgi:transcription factor TGA